MSFVKNVFDRDVTGRNPTDRGRQAPKISLSTDRRGTPLCSFFHIAKKSSCQLPGCATSNLLRLTERTPTRKEMDNMR
uniref:Uncharacterized protein n=1 Tax=viral metagenome TaxID=1070528 RepID=A0A6C0C2V2_9ZZZZ